MEHMELARALRADKDVHYNCCQSVLVTFADDVGLTREQAMALGANFHTGLCHGGTCGALCGAGMVLGLLGYGDPETGALIRQLKGERGATHCAALLKAARERGEERKAHCDGLVFEMVDYIQKLLDQRQG